MYVLFIEDSPRRLLALTPVNDNYENINSGSKEQQPLKKFVWVVVCTTFILIRPPPSLSVSVPLFISEDSCQILTL